MFRKQQLTEAVNLFHSLESYKQLLDDLGVSATFVLKKLIIEAANFYNEKKDGWFYLAIKHIVKDTGYCDKTVRKGIKTLERKGYIQVEYNNGNKSYYKILKLGAVTSYRASAVHPTALSGTASFNIKQDNINNKQDNSSGANGCDKKQNLNTELPNKEKLPNSGHTGAFAPNGGKNMRRTKTGYTRSDLRANSGRAATGEISPAPARKQNPFDKYTQEEIEFARSWWDYQRVDFRGYWINSKWKIEGPKWIEGMRIITQGTATKKPLCTFSELIAALTWVKNDKTCFYHDKCRSLAALPTKRWDRKGDNYLMIVKILEKYRERQQPKQQEKPFDIHNELTSLVRHTLAEKYDVREEYFDEMCTEFEKRLADIWDWLDKLNNKQPSNNKQNWLYGPKCAEKFVEVVRLWNEYGNGIEPVSGVRYAPWGRFWERVKVWQETELQNNDFGIWTITNLAHYMGK